MPIDRSMDVSSIALQGLEQASAQLDAAANGIVQAGAASANAANGAGVDTVSLSSEMVALMSAQQLFEANIDTLRTADEMQQSLLNVTA